MTGDEPRSPGPSGQDVPPGTERGRRPERPPRPRGQEARPSATGRLRHPSQEGTQTRLRLVLHGQRLDGGKGVLQVFQEAPGLVPLLAQILHRLSEGDRGLGVGADQTIGTLRREGALGRRNGPCLRSPDPDDAPPCRSLPGLLIPLRVGARPVRR